MTKFIVRSHNIKNHSIVTEASGPEEARENAMRHWYGDQPDHIIPHAPFYNGYGLFVEATLEDE
jgi:hypothetical protein